MITGPAASLHERAIQLGVGSEGRQDETCASIGAMTMYDCSRAGRAKLRAEQRRIDRFNALRRLDLDLDLNPGHGHLSSGQALAARFVLVMDFSGDQIRAARDLLGLTRHAFADVLGVSIRTVRTMEANGAGLVGGHFSTRKRVRE